MDLEEVTPVHASSVPQICGMLVGWPPSLGLSIIFMDADLWSEISPYLFSPKTLAVIQIWLRWSGKAQPVHSQPSVSSRSHLYGFGHHVNMLICSFPERKHRSGQLLLPL